MAGPLSFRKKVDGKKLSKSEHALRRFPTCPKSQGKHRIVETTTIFRTAPRLMSRSHRLLAQTQPISTRPQSTSTLAKTKKPHPERSESRAKPKDRRVLITECMPTCPPFRDSTHREEVPVRSPQTKLLFATRSRSLNS